MPSTKKQSSLRLSDDARRIMQEQADKTNVSQTEIVERALRLYEMRGMPQTAVELAAYEMNTVLELMSGGLQLISDQRATLQTLQTSTLIALKDLATAKAVFEQRIRLLQPGTWVRAEVESGQQ